MREVSKFISFVALFAAALVLAGCSLGAGSAPQQLELAPSATPEEINEQAVVEQPTDPGAEDQTEASDEGTAVETEGSSATPQTDLPDQGPIPTGSSLLKATDPSTVDLTDGRPKVVEFFAFW